MTFFEGVRSPGARDPIDIGCLDDKLGLWLRIAQRRFAQAVNRNFARHDVTQFDFVLLDLVERNAGCRLMALTQHLQLKPPNLVKTVDALVSRGLITKQADPDDRRANRLNITDHGARLLGELRHDYATAQGQIREAMGPTASDELLRLLRSLAGSAAER